MFNFLHTFHPEPILFSIGPVDIHWYGLFVLLGALAATAVTVKLASYYNINKDTILDLAFWLIIGGIIGARIYDVLLELPYYINHPLNVFKIWQGGLAIHGGIIAGIVIIWIFTNGTRKIFYRALALVMGALAPVKYGRIKPAEPDLKADRIYASRQINANQNNQRNHGFWLLIALLAPGIALAQAIGRWGNYFNQELFGLPTNLPWGIPIDIANRPAEYLSSQFFHPTFLYESIGNLIIFFILLAISAWIIKGHKNTTSYKLQAASYLILYSALRFSLEFIRIDTTPTLLGLRFPQVVSLLIIFLALLLLLLPKIKKNANIK